VPNLPEEEMVDDLVRHEAEEALEAHCARKPATSWKTQTRS
jgi:hypothetical protein